jgi:hypothetical protein
MNVRAKFKVDSIKQVVWNPTVRVIGLTAVCADEVLENQRFHKYTPAGTLEIHIDNPPVAEFFQLGKLVYLDFTEAK